MSFGIGRRQPQLDPQGLAFKRRLAIDMTRIIFLGEIAQRLAHTFLGRAASEGVHDFIRGPAAIEQRQHRDIKLAGEAEAALFRQQHDLAVTDDMNGELRADRQRPAKVQFHDCAPLSLRAIDHAAAQPLATSASRVGA